MIKEAYCSFEVSKLLQENGFDEKCSRWYVANEPQEGIVESGFGENQFYINAPTHQMAMKWLREKYNICIIIYPDKENGYEAVLYDIENDVEIVLQSFGVYGIHIYKEIYEEAVEAALKYTLENLI